MCYRRPYLADFSPSRYHLPDSDAGPASRSLRRWHFQVSRVSACFLNAAATQIHGAIHRRHLVYQDGEAHADGPGASTDVRPGVLMAPPPQRSTATRDAISLETLPHRALRWSSNVPNLPITAERGHSYVAHDIAHPSSAHAAHPTASTCRTRRPPRGR
ncbi:hypothetical protein G7046_g2914 [Stylonectria norvegica]|nr:hypothetical protein G7046_g2914 [Stylonectria norvegica]